MADDRAGDRGLRVVIPRDRDARRNEGDTRSILFWHGVQCVPVPIWVTGVRGMPLWVYAAHHMRGDLPWYQVPTFYRLNRAARIERGAVATHVSAMPPRSPDREPSWPCGRAR